MEVEQVAELARAVAGLPQAERDFFDGMVADERAAAADAERIAKLRAMADQDVFEHAIRGGTVFGLGGDELHILHGGILRVLREAGFVRKAPLTAPAYKDGTYAKGDRVQVRGVVYECLSDGVTTFFHARGGRDGKSVRLTTPHWRAV